MAKSKMYKAEKQHQREEDLNETEALDNQFKELMEGRILAGLVRPKGEKGKTPKGKSEDPNEVAFDVMRRELVFDAKAKVNQADLSQTVSSVSPLSCLHELQLVLERCSKSAEFPSPQHSVVFYY